MVLTLTSRRSLRTEERRAMCRPRTVPRSRADTCPAQLMLQLADEHSDIISQISCSLARHRKSDTIDRKDVQLAYGE